MKTPENGKVYVWRQRRFIIVGDELWEFVNLDDPHSMRGPKPLSMLPKGAMLVSTLSPTVQLAA